MRYLTLAVFAILGLTLSACATTSYPAGSAAYTPFEYQLGAGDRLDITVFGEESVSKAYVVSSAGDISFPLLGNIPVAGRTVSELQTVLTDGLSQGYMNDPRINVEVTNYRPFYILGEIIKPGEYSYDDKLTAYQAIALAGGFTYRADQNQISLRRAGATGWETYSLEAGNQVYIIPGDTIKVGERYF